MSDEPQAEEADTADSGIQDGDFVRLAYTLRTQEDESVIDTTDPEVATEAGLDDDEREFEPRVLVIGAGHLFPSVEDVILGADAGDSGTVDISADDAFGEYDDDEVRTISANKIDEDNQYPGAQVQIDDQQGRIITIINTRARVDFNHPLAGQDLEYEYEVRDIVEDPEIKAESLLGMYLQTPPSVQIETDMVEEQKPIETADESESEADVDGESDIEAEIEAEAELTAETETETVEVEKETLYVDSTPEMQMNQQWLFSKQQIAEEVIDRIDIDRMIIQETLDGQGGMMGGLGGMMGGMGPDLDAEEDAGADIDESDDVDIEETVEDLEDLEDVDIDAEELAAELGDVEE
ncbi:peptidylprolyl isomerase [Haloquadratum walsbyi]|uniref:peptidylprolyl isomerase n=1 Tax=Haloquadratum walsbyi J07HQW2 TaxID=1238425 RepID=U1MWG8_9EURY|nr:peptidylprolyl isomerase [Haloquadratum walsbyi]ERG94779.1 MAG: FKBP-type peptidyl-prolyl cis-trans isomerases 2 [Haloquadratum walsbyi J07HQW2]